MTWGLRGFGGDGGFAVGDNPIADLVDMEANPLRGTRAKAVVGRTVAVNAARLEQAVILGKLSGLIGIVDGVGASASIFYDRETGDIARTISDVNDVRDRNAAILGRHF